jgi:hypothetical protein
VAGNPIESLLEQIENMGIRIPEGTKEPQAIANYLGNHGL